MFEFEVYFHHHYSFRQECRWHAARGNAIGVIGHGVGHFDDVNNYSTFHRTAAVIVGLLRCNGFVFIEPKGMIMGGVGACYGDGLGVDLGVQALELACVTLNDARVGGDLGSVLVLYDAQFERVKFG